MAKDNYQEHAENLVRSGNQVALRALLAFPSADGVIDKNRLAFLALEAGQKDIYLSLSRRVDFNQAAVLELVEKGDPKVKQTLATIVAESDTTRAIQSGEENALNGLFVLAASHNVAIDINKLAYEALVAGQKDIYLGLTARQGFEQSKLLGLVEKGEPSARATLSNVVYEGLLKGNASIKELVKDKKIDGGEANPTLYTEFAARVDKLRDKFATGSTTNLVAHVREAGSRYEPACEAFDKAKDSPAMAFVDKLELISSVRQSPAALIIATNIKLALLRAERVLR